jgi:hypothetical protein
VFKGHWGYIFKVAAREYLMTWVGSPVSQSLLFLHWFLRTGLLTSLAECTLKPTRVFVYTIFPLRRRGRFTQTLLYLFLFVRTGGFPKYFQS